MRKFLILLATLVSVLAFSTTASGHYLNDGGGGPSPGGWCPWFMIGTGYPWGNDWLVCVDVGGGVGEWVLIPNNCTNWCPARP